MLREKPSSPHIHHVCTIPSYLDLQRRRRWVNGRWQDGGGLLGPSRCGYRCKLDAVLRLEFFPEDLNSELPTVHKPSLAGSEDGRQGLILVGELDGLVIHLVMVLL